MFKVSTEIFSVLYRLDSKFHLLLKLYVYFHSACMSQYYHYIGLGSLLIHPHSKTLVYEMLQDDYLS